MQCSLRKKVMLKAIIGKMISAILTLFLFSVIIFLLIRMTPGDPVKIMLGGVGDVPITNTEAYQKRVAQMREELGLNDHIIVQYGRWITRAMKLDFGNSIMTGRPVLQELGRRLPATLMLSVTAILIQMIIAVALGILSAVHAGKVCDELVRLLCVVVASVPGFVLGLGGLYLFGVDMHIFRIGTTAEWDRLWLPAITLGVIGIPQLARVVRANMLNQLGETYMIAAIARGLPLREVCVGGIRNIIAPIVTMLAFSFATLLGGSVVIENIFSWPGIGTYAMESVLNQDYPVIQMYAFVMVFSVILLNLFIDVVYIFINHEKAV